MDEHSRILIIDDDVDYACLVQVTFRQAGVTNSIETISDGWQAVRYLKEVRSTEGNSVPALVLLDLRLPGISGLDVLRWIKNQLRLADVPVLIFTGVATGDELSQARELGAAWLFTKPFSYGDLVRQLESIRQVYLETREFSKTA